MLRPRTLILAAALLAAGTLGVAAQGWGPGWGGGPGWSGGPGMRGGGPYMRQATAPCWRVQKPDQHAACWQQANDKKLWGAARREFVRGCVTK